MGYSLYINGGPATPVLSSLALAADSETLAAYAYDLAEPHAQIGGLHGFVWIVATSDGRIESPVYHI